MPSTRCSSKAPIVGPQRTWIVRISHGARSSSRRRPGHRERGARSAEEIGGARLGERHLQRGAARRRPFVHEADLEPVTAPAEGRQHRAVALETESRDGLDRRVRGAGRAHHGERMPVALGRGPGASVEPRAGMGVQREPERARTEQLRRRHRDLGPAGSSRYGLALRLISPNERSSVSASSRPSTTSYSVTWSRSTLHPSTLDEAGGREGRERHLAVSRFDRQPAIDDGELAFGRGTGHRRRQWDVEADPVVSESVVERYGDADERLVGAKLDGGRHRRSGPFRACGPSRPP